MKGKGLQANESENTHNDIRGTMTTRLEAIRWNAYPATCNAVQAGLRSGMFLLSLSCYKLRYMYISRNRTSRRRKKKKHWEAILTGETSVKSPAPTKGCRGVCCDGRSFRFGKLRARMERGRSYSFGRHRHTRLFFFASFELFLWLFHV